MTLVEYGKPYVLTEHPLPTPVGPQVLVRTTFAGICHSELHLREGKFNMGGGKTLDLPTSSLPHVLGHEIEGEVLAAGAGVPEGFLGKNFAVFPWLGCDKPDCVYCSDGWSNLCDSKETTKFADGKSMYGGYSSHVLVPHYKYRTPFQPADFP
jgi:D-arabinose 1-dehydrogenase-like Zn-dependent alcohol dehydrogenase